jgi:LysR family nod box-dependent transcriptional activator
MRFNRLDLNLLVALDVLLLERNVTRAAKRLHLSQSAMSGSLARLREYFEDELLVQVGRQLELTPRAQTLHEAVRDLLTRIDTSLAAQPKFDCKTTDREFKLLVSDYTSAVMIPHLLTMMREQGSTARVRLVPQVEQPARALERGEADLLVIPSKLCSPDHPTEVLFEDHFVCVVWQGSSHAQQGLDFERYLASGHVATQTVDNMPPVYESWFNARYGNSRRIEVRSFSFAVLPLLVVGTELIATVHATLAQLMRGAAPVRVLPLPLPAPMPPLEQCMQWHKYRAQDPGLIWMRQLLHEAGAKCAHP